MNKIKTYEMFFKFLFSFLLQENKISYKPLKLFCILPTGFKLF